MQEQHAHDHNHDHDHSFDKKALHLKKHQAVKKQKLQQRKHQK